MTVKEHVYAIKNLLAHGKISDDFSYSDRLIYHFLQVARGRLIEQKADKYRFISEQSFQNLCIDLELSSFHDCCGVDYTFDCLILKSTTIVPKFLNSRWGNFIKVMMLDGEVLPEINITNNKYSSYSITQADIRPGYFFHNNRLYVVNDKHLRKILLNGLFDNPVEVSLINCSTEQDQSTCDYMSSSFPIDPDLVDPMYRLCLELLLKSLQLPQDIESNAKDVVNNEQ